MAVGSVGLSAARRRTSVSRGRLCGVGLRASQGSSAWAAARLWPCSSPRAMERASACASSPVRQAAQSRKSLRKPSSIRSGGKTQAQCSKSLPNSATVCAWYSSHRAFQSSSRGIAMPVARWLGVACRPPSSMAHSACSAVTQAWRLSFHSSTRTKRGHAPSRPCSTSSRSRATSPSWMTTPADIGLMWSSSDHGGLPSQSTSVPASTRARSSRWQRARCSAVGWKTRRLSKPQSSRASAAQGTSTTRLGRTRGAPGAGRSRVEAARPPGARAGSTVQQSRSVTAPASSPSVVTARSRGQWLSSR